MPVHASSSEGSCTSAASPTTGATTRSRGSRPRRVRGRRTPVVELKKAVKALHAAGIEVILDVVYNHTAEGNEHGPDADLRGLDNRAYYCLPRQRPPALRRRHRLRQHRGLRPPIVQADPGCAALLSPRNSASTASASIWPRCWAATVRGFNSKSPFFAALRADPVLRLREAHRRTLGHRARAATSSAIFRPAGPSGTTVIATPCARSGAARRRMLGGFAERFAGSSDLFRAQRPQADRQHQLRRRARWLHAARHGRRTTTAQRGQPRREPRRPHPQPSAGTAASKVRPTTGASSRCAAARCATC